LESILDKLKNPRDYEVAWSKIDFQPKNVFTIFGNSSEFIDYSSVRITGASRLDLQVFDDIYIANVTPTFMKDLEIQIHFEDEVGFIHLTELADLLLLRGVDELRRI
jgi:hypothetical protein